MPVNTDSSSVYYGDDDRTSDLLLESNGTPISNSFESSGPPGKSLISKTSRRQQKTKNRQSDKGVRVKGHRLTLLKEIAKGSDDTVFYEGTYQGRKVAVKRFPWACSDVAKNESIHLKASDNHANVIRFHGTVESDGYIYLLFERFECNLYDLVKNNNKNPNWQTPHRYPSSDLLKLMKGIVAGIAHLHSLRVVHRDLNPHNVLIGKGKGLYPKLSNMSSSRSLAELKVSVGASGSKGWRAPEQIPHVRDQVCHGSQTEAMDLFTTGCVLHFCMTGGKHPFGPPNKRESKVKKNIVDLQLVQHIPEAVNLISKLLNPSPEQRPKASEVLLHPLFFLSEERMSFIWDASNWLKSKCEGGGLDFLAELEEKCCVDFYKSWHVKLDPAFLSHMEGYATYNPNKVYGLLRIIRNTKSHYIELPMQFKILLGDYPNGVDDYYRRRFPKLLMEVYIVMHHHCKHEDWFSKYLENKNC